jgi:spermidine synthase
VPHRGASVLHPERRSLPLAAALALFLLSGAGALVVETLWLRWLRALLGATAPAASATLVAFFLGQALGAALAARLARRAAAAPARPIGRNPLAVYGALELAAAAWALAVPTLLRLAESALFPLYDAAREQPGLLTALRFAAALAATLPASAAFGATLPALAAAVVGAPAALGRRGAALYGANVLGAALGTALASFWLPDALGVPAAYAVGVGALALAGGTALVAARRFGAPTAAPTEPTGSEPAERRSPSNEPAERRSLRAGRSAPAAPEARGARLAALAALSGFATFAAEILLLQSFALVLDQSVYAFGAVLCVVLLALGTAALAVAALLARGVDPRALLAVGLGGAALALLAFPAAFFRATDGLTLLASARPWPGYLLASLGIALATAGPALLAAGLVFPATLGAAGLRGGDAGTASRIGRLVAANTAGALAGALAAPWLLLPLLGLWAAFAAIAALYAAGALALAPAPPRGRAALATLLGVGAAGIALLAPPWRVAPVALAPGETLRALEATAAGQVAVVESDGDLRIQIDNHYALGGSAQAAHQERQAHVALLLRPGARRVAWIGSATGISAGAALLHPIERLALVELVPGVARAAARWFARWNRGVYGDPRSERVLDDGRNFLRATAERFDLVVADLFVPWQAGAAALYTREHFAAARARLAPGGAFCQWLPLYQLSDAELRIVMATFLDVFPDAALFRGDFYGRFPIVALVGYSGRAPDAAAIGAAAAALGRAGVVDRWVTHPIGFWSLYVGPLAPLAEELAAVPRNTDARPGLEFLTARSRAGGALAQGGAFTGVRFAAFARNVAAGLSEQDARFGALGAERLRAAAGGHALQSADALFGAGRTEESGRALAAASALLPRELLADAPPDPSAVSVWRDD